MGRFCTFHKLGAHHVLLAGVKVGGACFQKRLKNKTSYKKQISFEPLKMEFLEEERGREREVLHVWVGNEIISSGKSSIFDASEPFGYIA